jgi:hypothetical protein
VRVEFDEIDEESLPNHVKLDHSGGGPMLTIEHPGTESECYCINNTNRFMTTSEYEADFEKYLRYFNG